MYDLSDTVVAVSSPTGGVRSIVRLTGAQAFSICERLFEPSPRSEIKNQKSNIKHRMLLAGSVRINDVLVVDAWLYLFCAPRSYTGEDLAEIHVCASPVLVEALVQDLLARGLRLAGPGEFTARAYLHGKLDLAQAEAVNEIISSSNRLQLDAAQQLLSGRLTKVADEIHLQLLDVLSLIEAGLDFSGEDIEFLGVPEAAARLTAIRESLEELLTGSIRYGTLMDLPALGLAGAPNAGKSSLLNALLGWDRSIVSPHAKTTRDILTGVLTTDRFQCVLFDCAGLILAPDHPLDELAQHAAVAALQRCAAVLFCVDVTKPNPSADLALRSLLQPERAYERQASSGWQPQAQLGDGLAHAQELGSDCRPTIPKAGAPATPSPTPSQRLIYVATKSDLLTDDELTTRWRSLESIFHAEFLATSAHTKAGLPRLLDTCARVLTARDPGAAGETSAVALTARHRQAVTEALEQTAQATAEVRRGNAEVAGMMLRSACQALTQIQQQSLDEQVLDRIFSRFCIGK